MTKSELKITIDDDLAKSIEITIRKANRLDILYNQKIKNNKGNQNDWEQYFELQEELKQLQQIIGIKLMVRVNDLPF